MPTRTLRARCAHSAVTLSLLLTGCAPDPALREQGWPITDGDPVEDDALPTLGMLLARADVTRDGELVPDRVLGICTGTLISPSAVLTAEHCVNADLLEQSLGQARDADGNPVEVTLESDFRFQFTFARSLEAVLEGGALALDVARVDEHEGFAPQRNPLAALAPPPARWHDIAIAHLAEPLQNRPVQRLATPEITEALETGEGALYLAAGYGQTDDLDPMSAGTLTRGLSHLNRVGTHELVAGEDDRQQACRGDSGGPIFAGEDDTYQIGIASRVNQTFDLERLREALAKGLMAPRCETGLAYTRVDAYGDWIAARVDDLGEGLAPLPEDEPSVDAGAPAPDADADAGARAHKHAGGCSCDLPGGRSPDALWWLAGAAWWLARRRRQVEDRRSST